MCKARLEFRVCVTEAKPCTLGDSQLLSLRFIEMPEDVLIGGVKFALRVSIPTIFAGAHSAACGCVLTAVACQMGRNCILRQQANADKDYSYDRQQGRDSHSLDYPHFVRRKQESLSTSKHECPFIFTTVGDHVHTATLFSDLPRRFPSRTVATLAVRKPRSPRILPVSRQ